MSEKVINGKLLGSRATYLRCDGVVNSGVLGGFTWVYAVYQLPVFLTAILTLVIINK